MNILIVDGNDKNSSEEYTKIGMNTQYDEYEKSDGGSTIC